jgi:hypothetical protein
MDLKALKELIEILETKQEPETKLEKTHPYTIGQNLLIRTVTMYFVGKLVEVYDTELVLDNTSWVADTGRFSECLEKGTFSEVEYIGKRTIVGRGAIIDVNIFNNELPKKTI